MLRKVVSWLPASWQLALRRSWFTWRIRLGTFRNSEPELRRLSEWVGPGDCVLDIGANVGFYTARSSQLVGPNGHVFAFEPTPETFHLLAYNARLFPFPNVTLFNAAASDTFGFAGMAVPTSGDGLPDFYGAHLVASTAGRTIFRLPVDALSVPGRVSFVKIDVEGHELSVLRGMERLLAEQSPVLVLEGVSAEVKEFLRPFGYVDQHVDGSPNTVFLPARFRRDAAGDVTPFPASAAPVQ
jgi:FkbM family methyltransferase